VMRFRKTMAVSIYPTPGASPGLKGEDPAGAMRFRKTIAVSIYMTPGASPGFKGEDPAGAMRFRKLMAGSTYPTPGASPGSSTRRGFDCPYHRLKEPAYRRSGKRSLYRAMASSNLLRAPPPTTSALTPNTALDPNR